MALKYLSEIKDLKGKKVLLRLDLNVPIEEGVITDDFRIVKILPTLEFLKNSGAKTIILAHLEDKIEKSLKKVCDKLNQYEKVSFVEDIFSSNAEEIISSLKDGDFLLSENLRKWPGEKNNDSDFSKKLASFGDIYVNEAFSASHRGHASIVGIPKYLPNYAGLLFEKEIKNLSLAFNTDKHPYVFILGGAKFETKLPLVKKFLNKADEVFILGALANDFFKDKGYEVGGSVVAEEKINLDDMINSSKIYLPLDLAVKDGINIITRKPNEVLKSEAIIDCGPETISLLKSHINEANFIVWNGPLGKYSDGRKESTKMLGEMIASGKAFSIVGGGDTISGLDKSNLDKFSFLSTAGGAMLSFLIDETLPGIKALE